MWDWAAGILMRPRKSFSAHACRKPMNSWQQVHPACERLMVAVSPFASDRIVNPCHLHQIAFIRAVDEYGRRETLIRGLQRIDPRTVSHQGLNRLTWENLDVSPRQHVPQDHFCDMGLE